ncbi:hypothetical protein [Baaleninema sp.]|uniref:hypothetical protein n=1 Tax=Baaleninema sp. TaxID=3101197 RepID=UPI003D03E838
MGLGNGGTVEVRSRFEAAGRSRSLSEKNGFFSGLVEVRSKGSIAPRVGGSGREEYVMMSVTEVGSSYQNGDRAKENGISAISG